MLNLLRFPGFVALLDQVFHNGCGYPPPVTVAPPRTGRLSRRPRGTLRWCVALGGERHASLTARASWLPHAFCLGWYRVSGAWGGVGRKELGGGVASCPALLLQDF